MGKLLLIIIDGVPWRNWRRLFGNLEGWVEAGEARLFRMRSVLPSTSASCYASIHTGVAPQTHGVWGNEAVRRLDLPDIFSAVAAAGGGAGPSPTASGRSFSTAPPSIRCAISNTTNPPGPSTTAAFTRCRAMAAPTR